MKYSLGFQHRMFISDLEKNPFAVYDVDGNIAQTRTGAIFAENLSDVFLPKIIVDFVNTCLHEKKLFKIGFLTSRGTEDFLKLLEQSGITHPTQVTFAADSGAVVYIKGQKHEAFRLTEEEATYLGHLDGMVHGLKARILSVLIEHGLNPDVCPDLMLEKKGIAVNIHYREILFRYGLQESSAVAHEIGYQLKQSLYDFAMEGPTHEGRPALKTYDAPATVEVKLARVNKGMGYRMLAEAAIASDEPVGCCVYSADDVANGGFPGTDYYAMMSAIPLTDELGVPFYNIHTHHPAGNTLSGAPAPDPYKSPDMLVAKYPQPPIDLIVPDPAALLTVAVKMHGLICESVSKPGAKVLFTTAGGYKIETP